MNLSLIRLICLIIFFFMMIPYGYSNEQPPKLLRYMGSTICKKCHQEEYLAFITNAKKSKSFKSIEKMSKGLSPSDLKKCYTCHTTGYGKPGGFIDPEKTPHLKNAGCEVCHGPGSLHCETSNPAHIKGEVTTEDCKSCHTSERVKAFRYRPLVHGGGH